MSPEDPESRTTASEGTERFLEWLSSVPDPQERYRRATEELEEHQLAIRRLSAARARAVSEAYQSTRSVRQLASELRISPARAHQLMSEVDQEEEDGAPPSDTKRRGRRKKGEGA